MPNELQKDEVRKYVTPEYLLTHGFFQYKSVEEGDVCEIPFQNDDDLRFREIEFNRNMFVMILSMDYDHENHRHHEIYVQEDAGCGFSSIPERWWDLPIEYFEAIYYGIRGEKARLQPKQLPPPTNQ